MKIVTFIIGLCLFLAGFALGGYLFSKSIPRPFIAVSECRKSCFKTNELLGLLASLGIQNAKSVLPKVVFETDHTIVFDIQYPYPPDKIHYVVVPKKDIKNIGSLSEEDSRFLTDAFGVIGHLVRNDKEGDYRVITNGPGYQETTYLHLHVVIDRK